MPNHKKPPGTQQGHRSPGLSLVTETQHSETPSPPSGLLPENVELWHRYWQSPVATAALDVDIAVVERWILARDEWVQGVEIMRANRLVNGSMGQPVLNPIASWVASREATLQKCEAELGLTPMARNKLGIAVGQARLTAAELNRKTREVLELDSDDGEAEVVEQVADDNGEWEAG